jgi:molybdate transport repressor ModE-like protein
MRDVTDRLELRSEPVLYIDGKRVLDERGVRLISILDTVGSLLEASKRLGIPYSRVWEYIAKLERFLKIDILEVGGGGRRRGVELTPEGVKLVKYIKDFVKSGLEPTSSYYEVDIHIAGSDDIVLDSFLGELRKRGGLTILYSKIGSLRGLSSILLGDAQIAPIHLIDPDSGEYNTPYIRKLCLEGYVSILHGYHREVGFIYRKGVEFSSIEDIVEGEYIFINRCRGSGIKVLFDKIVKEYASSKGLDVRDVLKSIRGYDEEVETHSEIISRLLNGAADVAVGLRTEALSHGLSFRPLIWERFDFVVAKELLDSEEWRWFYGSFIELIPQLVRSIEGYRVSENFGELIDL